MKTLLLMLAAAATAVTALPAAGSQNGATTAVAGSVYVECVSDDCYTSEVSITTTLESDVASLSLCATTGPDGEIGALPEPGLCSIHGANDAVATASVFFYEGSEPGSWAASMIGPDNVYVTDGAGTHEITGLSISVNPIVPGVAVLHMILGLTSVDHRSWRLEGLVHPNSDDGRPFGDSLFVLAETPSTPI